MELYDSKSYLEEPPSFDEIIRTYCYCMYFYLDQFYYELHERIDSPYILQYGIMLVHEIFATSLLHTRNIQATKKAVEQSIQYYKEYLGQIYSQFLKLNPTDAYRFVLKKTIQLIPLHCRQNTNERDNEWFIHCLSYIEHWTMFSIMCISYYQKSWLSYESDNLYQQYRTFFNQITDIIQECTKLEISDFNHQKIWHDTLISTGLSPQIILYFVKKYLHHTIDLERFREKWNSNEFHNQMDTIPCL
jgi:hypothetical protein